MYSGDLKSEHLNRELSLVHYSELKVSYSSYDQNSELKVCYSSHQSSNLSVKQPIYAG